MTNQAKMPWMVSALLGFGAWLACALSLLFFLKQNLAPWVGLGFVLLAYGLDWGAARCGGAWGAFWAQASLAFSLCGKGLLLFGLGKEYHLGLGGGFAVATVLAALSYPLFRHPLDRTAVVWAAGCLGMGYLYETLHGPWAYLELLSVGVFAVAYALFWMRREWMQPVAWALWGTCFIPVLVALFNDGGTMGFGSLNSLLLGVVLCAFYVWRERKQSSVWIAALVLMVAYLSNTGTLMGGALVCLGLAQKRRLPAVAGGSVFALSLVWLYYHMQTTLLVKSFYLCGAGALLLLAYAVLKKGDAHAQ